ncbi:HAAS signaling domain-containing protein [Saccharopolyspora taberi]|uniref:DUF1700 domain-containing protein n=1 Tax=Saccharopolyspora taberi TaxID=60895 RepID=A0ABN3V6V0_9PSEU
MMTLEKKYRDELLVALRLHDISGARVGEVLAEVEAHVAETGEDPAEAFGSPREYAARVAAQLDRRTGNPSNLEKTAGAAATGVLVFFGLVFLLDGLRGDAVVTLADAVSEVLRLVLILVAVFLGLRAATALSGRAVLGVAALVSFGVAIGSSILIKQVLDDSAPLFVLSSWVSIGLGAVLVAGSLVMLARAIKRGRVVDPR